MITIKKNPSFLRTEISISHSLRQSLRMGVGNNLGGLKKDVGDLKKLLMQLRSNSNVGRSHAFQFLADFISNAHLPPISA